MTPVFIAPWIVFSIPPQLVLFQPLVFTVLMVVMGTAGILSQKGAVVSLTFAILMVLMISGEVYSHISGRPGPDSAVFLIQFVMILFLYEASSTVVKFDKVNSRTKAKDDHFSRNASAQVKEWMRRQFLSLSELTLGAVGLSLALVVIGGFANVSIDQIGFTAVLVLAAVIAILFLLTYRREPD
ncbi:MAG TPA: hypothetical protein VFE98_07000 [Candidatus Bathyarchaeia archaeon]|nr:hypothetical protein [Candidatus Bathyarchaeia archaeon]